MVRVQLLLASFILFLFSLLAWAESVKADMQSLQSLSCQLKKVTVLRDADQDPIYSYEELSASTLDLSRRENFIEEGRKDTRFYYSLSFIENYVRLYIKDKSHNTALQYAGSFNGSAEWLLSEPGSEVDQGLLLTCQTSK